MSISEVIQNASLWLAWIGLGLALITITSYIARWGVKFRLTGATIFTLLLAASCWAFEKSYSPPFEVKGYKYAPIVYDNGFDLVVAQGSEDFPEEAIQPTLEQIAGNLKGGGRNGALVRVRLRKVSPAGNGISEPIILGEVIRDTNGGVTIESDFQPTKDKTDEIEKFNPKENSYNQDLTDGISKSNAYIEPLLTIEDSTAE